VLAHAVVMFLEPPPWDVEDAFVHLPLVGLWFLGGVALVVIALVLRKPLPAIAVAVVLASFVTSLVVGESIHWRWSRDKFEAAAADGELQCVGFDGCRVGWWDARAVEDFGSFTVVWTEPGCYRQGFATGDRDVAEEDIAAVLNETPGSAYEVTTWYDGWFEVCGHFLS
jgi:hypothetical protein